MVRDALRMIAGGHRTDAHIALGLAELQKLVERAVFLERGSGLQILEFEESVHPQILESVQLSRHGVFSIAPARRALAPTVGGALTIDP